VEARSRPLKAYTVDHANFTRYPVRDPFFKMLPRSLSTFMNAFTSSDHTSYPFSTTNHQDFKNLMSVYLDATLFPLLKESDFRQEGWHLGTGNSTESTKSYQVGDSNPPVLFKGVVYNEMKGMMSDASYVFHVRWNDHIFPAIHNSGGDPQKITDLTHGELVAFHKRNYHPSNAKIFTYGNMPLSDHLQQVGEVLSQFEKKDKDFDVRLPLNLDDGPQHVTVDGPFDPAANSSKQHKSSLTWLTGDTGDVNENFSLAIISSVLLEGYGSPMHKALIESELGSHFTPNTGLDVSGKIGTFSVGLGGVDKNDVSKIKAAVTTVFENLVFQGVDDGKVQGILHQLELTLKHQSPAFGMGLLQKVSSGWFNGVDPTKLVVWNDLVSKFKENYQEEGYLENLVIKHLLNDRYLSFTMEPSQTFQQEINEEEIARVRDKFEAHSKSSGSANVTEAVGYLVEQEDKLVEVQERGRTQDTSCLPSLKVEDISRQTQQKPVEMSALDNNVSVQWRRTATNGLTYFKALHTFDSLQGSLRTILPLFLDCLLRLGTRDQSMEELEDAMKLKTGGIGFSRHSATSPHNLGSWREGLLSHGVALDKHVPTLLHMTRKLILETDFSGPKSRGMIRELLKSQVSGIVDGIANSGHAFARTHAASFLQRKLREDEEFSGLFQMAWLLNQFPDGEVHDQVLDVVIEGLKSIQAQAISNSGSNLRLSLTCEPEAAAANETALRGFLSDLPSLPWQGHSTSPKELFPLATELYGQQLNDTTGHLVFWDLPYQVYYSGVAVHTAPFVDPDTAPLAILCELLTHRYLHHEIREKGGAYGGGAALSMRDGFLSMTSYRDPNPVRSMLTYENVGPWAAGQKWTDRDLTEAKLSVFQGIDAPVSVDQEGDRQFLRGVDDTMTQQLRERLLDVTASDVSNMAAKYLLAGSQNRNMCIVGQKQDWVQADTWEIKGLRQEAASRKRSGIWDAIATGAVLGWLL
jgi:presequence protease